MENTSHLDEFMDKAAVIAATGYSDGGLWRARKSGAFPEPAATFSKSPVWRCEDVLNFINNRDAAKTARYKNRAKPGSLASV